MESFDFDARTREYSRKNAFWLGRASRLAYFGEDQARSGVGSWGLTDFEYFERQDTQAFIAGNADLIILAFRGTEDLTDWMTDFDVALVGGPGGKVHEGFQAALLQVWKEIWRYVQTSRRGRSLWVTGHSLGAALATLAVAKLRLEKDEPVNGLYNFGQPRAGDRDFQRTFDADFERQTFRYVNHSDVVTRVPFRSMGYSHVGLSRYFDQNGVQRDDVSWWDLIVDRVTGDLRELVKREAPGLQDHNLDGPLGYVANLERAVQAA